MIRLFEEKCKQSFDLLDTHFNIIYQNVDSITRLKLRGTCLGFNNPKICNKIEKLFNINKFLDPFTKGKLRMVSKLFNEPFVRLDDDDFLESYNQRKIGWYHTNEDYELIASENNDDIELYNYYYEKEQSAILFSKNFTVKNNYNETFTRVYEKWVKKYLC